MKANFHHTSFVWLVVVLLLVALPLLSACGQRLPLPNPPGKIDDSRRY